MEQDIFNMTMLLDYYGGTLTDKQREYLEFYYNEDLSLAEIAEITGISRPGVYDIINRSRNKLIQLEQKTGIVERFMQIRSAVEETMKLAEETGADARVIEMLKEVANGV